MNLKLLKQIKFRIPSNNLPFILPVAADSQIFSLSTTTISE